MVSFISKSDSAEREILAIENLSTEFDQTLGGKTIRGSEEDEKLQIPLRLPQLLIRRELSFRKASGQFMNYFISSPLPSAQH